MTAFALTATRRATLLGALLLSTPLAFAQTWDASKSQRLDSLMRDLMGTALVPGGAVSVVLNGQIVFERGFGVRKFGGAAVDNGTQFQVASVTKPMTAMMMASAVDAGRISWTTTAKSVLPSFRVADATASNQLTVADLLCNCAGLPRIDYQAFYRAPVLTPMNIIGQLAPQPTDSPIGQRFTYHNQAVATGGWLAAGAASGGTGWQSNPSLTYANELRNRVFNRIGMGNSSSLVSEVTARNNYAFPHAIAITYQNSELPARNLQALQSVQPAGAVWSTAGDLARFMITQINRGVAPNGTRVVSQAALAKTWQPRVTIDETDSYGLGTFISSYSGRRMIGHDGNGIGATASMQFLPDHGAGVAVLTNRGASLVPAFVRSYVFDLLFDQVDAEGEIGYRGAMADIVASQATNYANFASSLSGLSPSEINAIVGTWRHPILGTLQITNAGGGLVRYTAEGFVNRLARGVSSNGTVLYFFRDPEYLAEFTLVPVGNRLDVVHQNQIYSFTR